MTKDNKVKIEDMLNKIGERDPKLKEALIEMSKKDLIGQQRAIETLSKLEKGQRENSAEIELSKFTKMGKLQQILAELPREQAKKVVTLAQETLDKMKQTEPSRMPQEVRDTLGAGLRSVNIPEGAKVAFAKEMTDITQQEIADTQKKRGKMAQVIEAIKKGLVRVGQSLGLSKPLDRAQSQTQTHTQKVLAERNKPSRPTRDRR